MKITVVAGCDGVGKSTWINKNFKKDLIKKGIKVVSLNALRIQVAELNFANKPYVWDRHSLLDSFIYSSFEKEKVAMSLGNLIKVWNEIEKHMHIEIIYINKPIEVILKQINERQDDDLDYDAKKIRFIQRRYEKYFDLLSKIKTKCKVTIVRL